MKCISVTKLNKRCKKTTIKNGSYCFIHHVDEPIDEPVEEPIEVVEEPTKVVVEEVTEEPVEEPINCLAITKSNKPCKKSAMSGSIFCNIHKNHRIESTNHYNEYDCNCYSLINNNYEYDMYQSLKTLILACEKFTDGSEFYLTMLENNINIENRSSFIFLFNIIKPFFVNILSTIDFVEGKLLYIQKVKAVKNFCLYTRYFAKKLYITNFDDCNLTEKLTKRIEEMHNAYKEETQNVFLKKQKLNLLKKTSIIEDIITHHISQYL